MALERIEYDLLPYGRPLNGLFADNARFNLVIEPKVRQHDHHVWIWRRQWAWDAFKARFTEEYPVVGYDMAKEPKPGSGMTDDESGIGIVGNTVNQVEKDAPPFKPTIVDDEGNVIEDPDADEGA